MPDKENKEEKAKPAARQNLAIRLVPANQSDAPVVANYASVHASQGMVFIDFGLLEPSVVAALPQAARQGKLPEAVSGRLASRVAIGAEALRALHAQLGRLIAEEPKSNSKNAGPRS